jgi:hypothetical protein
MVDAVLSKRRVDPEKVDRLREYFDSLADRQEVFERGLDIENVRAEAAFLRTDENGPVLYYYMERGEDHPPDIEPEEIEDEAVLELAAEHEAALEDACVESARDEDGDLRQFETLFFASSVDREG